MFSILAEAKQRLEDAVGPCRIIEGSTSSDSCRCLVACLSSGELYSLLDTGQNTARIVRIPQFPGTRRADIEA